MELNVYVHACCPSLAVYDTVNFVSLSTQYQSNILLLTVTGKHGIANLVSQVHTGLSSEYFITEPDV